jgi:hypothetical protein
MQQWWQNAQPGSTEYRRVKGTFRQSISSTRGLPGETSQEMASVCSIGDPLWATNAVEVHSSQDFQGKTSETTTITWPISPLCPGQSVRTPESKEIICKRMVGSRCRVAPRTLNRSICINTRATRRALDIKRVEEDLTRSR